MGTPLHIIILAAGDGTRMKSRLPKVLQPLAGTPMLVHVLQSAGELTPASIHIVCNPDDREALSGVSPDDAVLVNQAERLGTGHAVLQALPGIPPEAGVLVLYGDTPLVPAGLLHELVEAGQGGLAILTMQPECPDGYGRAIRDAQGRLERIVEERDASGEQKAIREVNSGILFAPCGDLLRWLGEVGNANSQGEYYLTDVVAAARAEGAAVTALCAPEAGLLEGANDQVQLARLNARYRALAAEQLMRAGVLIADPARVELRGDIRAGQDVQIDVDAVLEGRIRLGNGVRIGPGSVLRDCELADGTRVHAYSVMEGVTTRGPCDIGPFARLRPGTVLEAGSRVGNFVEVKNATLGEGSKANHLSYLGDASIGRGVNIGAGTITCNYDGAHKHRTVIGDGAFIGSDTQLVAPVSVGEGATVGAGTTLTRDAPAGQLTVGRAKQVSVKGWKRPVKGD